MSDSINPNQRARSSRINKTFIAEYIKITEFYYNLNKKNYSDEEIQIIYIRLEKTKKLMCTYTYVVGFMMYIIFSHTFIIKLNLIVEYPKSQRQRSRQTP